MLPPRTPQLAVYVRQWRQLNTDLPALLDGWAASLFTELDYRVEAANGKRFKELYSMLEVRGKRGGRQCGGALGGWVGGKRKACMSQMSRKWESTLHVQSRPLSACPSPLPTCKPCAPTAAAAQQDVFVPEMNLELTTRKVLVMEWVDGERLRTAYTQVGGWQLGQGGQVGVRQSGARAELLIPPFLYCGWGPSCMSIGKDEGQPRYLCLRGLQAQSALHVMHRRPAAAGAGPATTCGWWRWGCGAAWSRCWRWGGTTQTHTQ